MEKIRLLNNETFELITCGVDCTPEKIVFFILPGNTTLTEVETAFNPENTKKIYRLSAQDEEELQLYTGYTKLVDIEKRKDAEIDTNITETGEVTAVLGDLIRVELVKPNETEERIKSLEETVDTLTLEILGM